MSLANAIPFLTLEFPPHHGGVGRMYELLCKAAPCPIEVITPVAINGQYETYSVRQTQLLSNTGWPRWRATLFFLWRRYHQQPFPRLIVGQVLPLGIAACIFSFIRPVKYGVFVHGMDVTIPLRHWRKRWVLRQILLRAHVVYAANAHVGNLVQTLGVKKEHITIVYPSPYVLPATEVRENSKNQLPPSAHILLSVARLVERKGHDIILSALPEVWEQQPDTYYLIIGDGPQRTILEQQARALPRPQVHFLGDCSDDDLRYWLNRADVFVLTPRELPSGDIEGLGIVYLEAGAFGLPVIGSRTGGVGEAIQNERTGLLVSPNNVPETAKAILRLLGDAPLRKRLGEAGAEWAKQFSPVLSARRMIESLL